MRLAPCLDSTISNPWRQLKGCALRTAGHYLSPPQNCGCSSVVEHLLAKSAWQSLQIVLISPHAGSHRQIARSLCSDVLCADLKRGSSPYKTAGYELRTVERWRVPSASPP